MLGNRREENFDLPRKLDTLKRIVRSHLPMLRLLRKAVRVSFKKVASMPAQEKVQGHVTIQRVTWLYWYDPKDLVDQPSKILKIDELLGDSGEDTNNEED